MNPFQSLFDAQKSYFASNVTRSHAWRVEQLDRMGKMVKENEAALQKAIARDFKTASQEHIFETATAVTETEFQNSQLSSWMAPTEAPVPTVLAKAGHKGMVYRDPYGVVLVIGPSNGPLTLLLRPAIAVLAAVRDGFRCGLIEPSLTLHRLRPYRSSNRTARRDPRSGCMPVPRPPTTLGRGDNWTMADRRLSPYRSRASPTPKLPAFTNFAPSTAIARASGPQCLQRDCIARLP